MVQELLYAFLIALTNNVDNVGARVAYSIQGTKISTPINLWISVITFVISLAAAVSGTMISGALGKGISSVIAMVFLVAIGLWMILEPRLKRLYSAKLSKDNSKGVLGILLRPESADMDNSKHIDFKEATFLGVALSLNNVGGGLSAGMLGLNSLLVGFLSAVLSFVSLWAGNYLAEFFIRRNISEKAGFVGGVLLIAIGIGQLF
jgi:putative sporulation protein YtaF